jgi:hypothetical protein
VESGLTKVPGKPSLRYVKGQGIYRLVKVEESWETVDILDWCPTVLRYVVGKDSRGKITSARYTVEVGGHEDTIFAEELRSGEGWDRFPQATGHHDRQVKDTLACIVTHQAAQLPQTVAAPYWDGDLLRMSDPDLMPPGYGDRMGAALEEILPTAIANPKLALVLGFGYAAPYVEPLDRQSFWCHMTGGAREGKSTGLNLAACVWGKPRPRGVIIPWNTTAGGPSAALSELSVLPAFFDDLHAAGFTPAQVRKMIFATAEGNSRLRSTRSGRRKDSPPWYGVLFSTGNDSILSMLPQAEVAARVVEIPSPLTDSAATSKRVKDWAKVNYGHWRAVPIVTMRAAVDQAEELLRGGIDGGTEETIMENLALGVAGAYVVGGKPLADAALSAAREILDVLSVELAESGVKPGDKLLEAVRQYLVARPGAFPTRQEYGAALADTSRPAPAVQGFWEPPLAYIITSHMGAIAAGYGLADPRVGLRELRKAGLLDTQASANQLRKQVRAAGRRFDAYAIRMEDTDSPAPSGKPDSTSDTSATSDAAGQTLWNPSLVPSATSDTPAYAQVNATPQPVTPQVESTPPDATAVTGPVTLDEPDRIAPGARSGHSGEPRDTGPVTQRPVRAVSASSRAEDAEEWERWCEIIRSEDAWPQATTEQCLAGLKMFSRALGGLRHLGTSAVVGQLLFHKLQAQHGSIPVLEEGGLPQELGDVARTFNYVDTAAQVEGRPWVLAMDVNAQFLAVTGAVELGTGYPQEVTVPTFTDPRQAKRYYSKPGYVQVASDTPIAGACVIPEGYWIAHPVAAYLQERGGLQVASQGLLWPEHRRWLSAWGDVVRRGRAALLARKGDQAAEMALHALKLMYAAFLGGFLRSEAYNRGKTLRPDWNDQLTGLARVNMLRALDRCQPSAFATHLDAAFFLLEDNAGVQGLQVTPQAGKWKVAKVGRTEGPATIIRGGRPISTTLAEQVALGSVAGVRDVVADLDAQRREVAA